MGSFIGLDCNDGRAEAEHDHAIAAANLEQTEPHQAIKGVGHDGCAGVLTLPVEVDWVLALGNKSDSNEK